GQVARRAVEKFKRENVPANGGCAGQVVRRAGTGFCEN
ncbi:hypothetical protein A2U01_0081681, partial [Trifolium medium]|nr:hypothetical protein [Trifolium medium]